jgi:hypothetical protein
MKVQSPSGSLVSARLLLSREKLFHEIFHTRSPRMLFFLIHNPRFSGGDSIGIKHGAQAHLSDQRSGQAQGTTYLF